jgi:hypothetical protein
MRSVTMPKGSVSIEIEAPCEAVFALIHNYEQRLAWDTMLSEAAIIDGSPAAAKGVATRCVGTWRSGRIPMETVYVNFQPGRLAAVKLINRPPFFKRFAATIKHSALTTSRSRVDYIYSFQARPRFLARVLEPLMNAALNWETQNRLTALRDFLERPS